MSDKTQEKRVRGRPIKKGQFLPSPANTPLSTDDKLLRHVTKTNAKNIIMKHSNSTYKQLKEKLKNKDRLPCLELLIMRTMESAIASADLKKLDWIYVQLFGKPKVVQTNTKTINFSYDVNGNKTGMVATEQLEEDMLSSYDKEEEDIEKELETDIVEYYEKNKKDLLNEK